jgi:NADPH:quinone reductase-like Zn-dependent oxidoreductase/SAM-dependent methyltransferase/acyl carrier protein
LLEDGEKGVLPLYQPLLEKMIGMLAKDGLVRKTHSAWKLRPANQMPDADALWRKLVADHPARLPELVLLARCAERMVSILRGETEPLEIISRGMLEHLYESVPDARFYNQLTADLMSEIAAVWPETRPLRILEIGAGTGGSTSWLLPRLPRDNTEYVFTDIGDVFLGEAEARFSKYPFVRYGLLNIERDPVDQGYAPGSFDIIIAANALHATKDLKTTLGNARSLLVEGGMLLLMEGHEQRKLDMIFGLLKGWWAFEDYDIRPDSAMLSEKAWSDVLAEAGFAEIQAINDAAVSGSPVATIFLSRNETGAAASGIETTLPDVEPRSWLVFADGEGDTGMQIASALSDERHRVVTVRSGTGFERLDETNFAIAPDDSEAMLELCRILRNEQISCEEIVHCWGLDAAPAEGVDALEVAIELRCLSTMNVLQALLQARWPNVPRLWLLTSGALAHPGRKDGPVPSQAPLWGLGRVIANEHPELRIKMIDLDPARDRRVVSDHMMTEFAAPDDEDEILMGADARFVNRLRRTSIGGQIRRFRPGRSGNGKERSFVLDFTAQGALDNLYLRETSTPAPAPDQVLIKVRAAGLNFHDVMWAMGMLPAEAVESGSAGPALGLECSGVVAACGKNVAEFAPGDEVIAFGGGCFGSHILAEPKSVAPKPAHISFEEAATIPSVFFTAYYALDTLARLNQGEKILIHGAAGGVGLAAIQIAKSKGAEIFATAGTPEKRDFVRMLGADHVLDSRSLSFADDVMRITRGEGIDVVLNSLAGEAIRKNLDLLKPFGRFLEIGKRDLYANSKMGLRPFRNNISYFAIDADQLMREKPELAGRLFREVISELKDTKFRPIVHRTFPISRVVEAFRHMQQSRHIGKIIVSMEDADNLEIVSPDRGTLELRADASYLVTGGLSGFGLATARWMADKGARNLILMGRRGVATAEARTGVAALETAGVKVHVAKCDVSDEAALGRALADADRHMPPLKGVIHAAMVLDDGILMQSDRDRLMQVIKPKVMGAWNLHHQTLDRAIDFFVLYSSATAVFGNPGQGNYVAANLYLEALAQHRRSLGLPALAVGWGAIDDVGYVARMRDVKEFLETRSGLRAITSSKALDTLEQLMLSGAISVSASDFNWPKTLKILPSAESPRYAYVGGLETDDGTEGGPIEGLADLLTELPQEERVEMLTQLIAEQVGKILRISPSKLDVNRSILEMGIDSLMGVEMQMSIEKQFGVEIPTMELMGGISITQIAGRILIGIMGDGPAAQTTAATDTELREEMTMQVDEFSDEAIDVYLEVLAGESTNLEDRTQ